LIDQNIDIDMDESNVDYTDQVHIDYHAIDKRKWNKSLILSQLRDYLSWMASNPSNCHFSEYVEYLRKKREYIPVDWYYTIEARFREVSGNTPISRNIRACLDKISLVLQNRKIELAQKGNLSAAPVTFELKAKYKWRDGSETAAPVAVNMAIHGLSQEQLESKISALLEQGSLKDRLSRAKEVQAEYQEITAPGC
jgi:hypothetical protein